ncbi:MAG: diguanylate cyclase [Blastocatellia bacterium]|nr:diguanylate cyclase [Blastocatellia bacterium]
MAENPEKKAKFLDRIANESGVAIVVLDERSAIVSESNNNSICVSLNASPEFSPACAAECGRAFENAFKERKAFDYECHAGLQCRALPVQDAGKPFVAIIGRTFVKAANYRKTTEKAISGEWNSLPPSAFFDNVLISGSTSNIESVSEKLAKFAAAEPENVLELEAPVKGPAEKPVYTTEARALPKRAESESISRLIEKFNQERNRVAGPAEPSREHDDEPRPDKFERAGGSIAGRSARPTAEVPPVQDAIAAWRSHMGSLMTLPYPRACDAVLAFLAVRYKVDSLIWLEQRNGSFASVASLGALKGKSVHINLRADNQRLLDAVADQFPLELRERSSAKPAADCRKLLIFPVRVGPDIRAAIGIEVPADSAIELKDISRFAGTIGPQIEILRLRHEATSRDWLARGVRRFSESLSQIDNDDFWTQMTRATAELLRAERVSLLLRDEGSGQLLPKASIGSAVDLATTPEIGDRVAARTLESGSTLLVTDLDAAKLTPAPADWRYRTSSFISFPIMIGDRRLAIMNFTDRAEGGVFGESDVELLETIAPQIAVAIDRGKLKLRAGELEKRSITDSLTGLMNRGYIEERLIEEMNRASRHRFPMSLLMIDVDHFKTYNDSFGHPAGDIALRRVANALKETLRAADVAARYGGEEFAVLLPQTPIEEASAIAERLRQRVERTEFPKRQVTISIGVASYSSEFTEPKDWITAADMALYEAKELGRNNVQLYENLGRSFREKIH